MKIAENKALPIAIRLALIAYAILLVCGFIFLSRHFGYLSPIFALFILALPLAVAVRLCRRWPAIRLRELALLACLFLAAAGAGVFMVQSWYAAGFDRDHAEDMRWAEFERRMRLDPAFRDVTVHESVRKNVHWVSGVLDSESDLARLKAMAIECGIEQGLEGPFQENKSLSVRD